MAHLGGIAQRGPGFIMVEATAVEPEGRITPQDAGLWQDSQIEPMRQVIEFIHSQNQKVGVQIAHAGRKASTVAPWLSFNDTAVAEVGGWPDRVKGPSDKPFTDRCPTPKAMTKQDIEDLKTKWVAAVKRAVAAGADFIEIHNAHGYLLMSFLSPAVNTRTDEYGGSPEKRCRFVLELMDELAKTIGEENLAIRLSPFGLFNQARGEQRLETWSHLCEQLKQAHPTLSYVSFIEPVRTLS